MILQSKYTYRIVVLLDLNSNWKHIIEAADFVLWELCYGEASKPSPLHIISRLFYNTINIWSVTCPLTPPHNEAMQGFMSNNCTCEPTQSIVGDCVGTVQSSLWMVGSYVVILYGTCQSHCWTRGEIIWTWLLGTAFTPKYVWPHTPSQSFSLMAGLSKQPFGCTRWRLGQNSSTKQMISWSTGCVGWIHFICFFVSSDS